MKQTLNQKGVCHGTGSYAESIGRTDAIENISSAARKKTLCSLAVKEAGNIRVCNFSAHENNERCRFGLWREVRLSHPLSSAAGGRRFSLGTIQKNANSEKWQTQLHLINKNANINQIEKKEYESFYKILMEPKSTLQQTLHQLLSSANGNNQNSDKDSNNHFFSPASISTDLLAGTWGGEENINKIVIMRSGRGFVIFKNGASMNILIKIQKAESDTKVIITQESRPNASFFPELPRTVALQAAKEAEPIEWTLSLLNDNTLSGTKKTLTLASDNQTSMSKLNVTWHRK